MNKLRKLNIYERAVKYRDLIIDSRLEEFPEWATKVNNQQCFHINLSLKTKAWWGGEADTFVMATWVICINSRDWKMSQIWMVICSYLGDHVLLWGSVCLVELRVKEGSSRPLWHIMLIIYMTDYYWGKHFQTRPETLHYADTGDAALTCLTI